MWPRILKGAVAGRYFCNVTGLCSVHMELYCYCTDYQTTEVQPLLCLLGNMQDSILFIFFRNCPKKLTWMSTTTVLFFFTLLTPSFVVCQKGLLFKVLLSPSCTRPKYFHTYIYCVFTLNCSSLFKTQHVPVTLSPAVCLALSSVSSVSCEVAPPSAVCSLSQTHQNTLLPTGW